jgi:glycosyltransferase involved in cell wall biosynthesis
MNILIIATSSQIPVINYGGTERVIWDLGKSLTQLGHKITFLVQKGSFCDFANIIHFDSTKPIKAQIPLNFDIIHSHSVENIEDINLPSVFTLHGNASKDFKPLKNMICISQNHAKRHDRNTYVYNGLDWNNYKNVTLNEKRSYFHFLGKATWSAKNLKDAAKIAVKSKNTLNVLGGEKWNFKNLKSGTYYKAHPFIKYHGMVNDTTKMEVMKKSKGLIFPIKWHEPFGLAIIESMYAGAPVFGTAFGALPELVNEDVGFVNNSVEALIHAVSSKTYAPKTCRNYVVDKFNSKTMALNYIEKYEQVLDGTPLN